MEFRYQKTYLTYLLSIMIVIMIMITTIINMSLVYANDSAKVISEIKEGSLSTEELATLDQIEQKELSSNENESLQPVPDKISGLPNVNERNGFGITITKEIRDIYKNMYEGNATEALHILEKISAKDSSSTNANKDIIINKWFLSTLKSQILVLLDLAADAEIELIEKTAKLEIEYFAHNFTSIALRGEARLWLNDLKNAKRDFAKVALALIDWQLPTSYNAPPSEPEKMYNLASVQLRAFVGMAGVYSAMGDLTKAYPWAKRAENAFSRIQYVVNHPQYGSLFPAPPDLYYGRGMNLGLLAASSILIDKKDKENKGNKENKLAKKYLDLSLKFFEKINYPLGKVTVQALQAQAYNSIDMPEEANKVAVQALNIASKYLWSNLIWRIETLRGTVLIKLKKPKEARTAYRNAQSAVELISGNLQTDRSKVRFGVGKEDITYNLIKFDLEDKDYDTLFADLERGRARAFTDMLAVRSTGRTTNTNTESESESELEKKVAEISKLSERLRVITMHRNAPNSHNVNNANKMKTLNEEEKKIRIQREQKIKELEKISPEMASIFEIQVPNLRSVKERLSADEGIAYFLPLKDDENVQVLLISKNKVEIISLPSKLKEIRDAIFDLNDDFNSGNVEAQKEKAKILSDKLDINKIIKNKINYIVASKDIFFVPWGAMQISNPVSVIPMGNWILQGNKDKKDNKNNSNKNISTAKAVIVGNPEFAGSYPQLQGAEAEAKNIAEIYKVTPLIGKEATIKNIRDQIGDGCNILHLSTHGIFNVSKPLDSAIILSDGVKAFPLNAEMIVSNPLKARVVILSACETGMGKAMSGDDFVGITRSFYLGGAKTIIYSIRKVDDQSTATFMNELHKEAQKVNFIDAAFLARKKMIETGAPPSAYGAFIVGGLKN
ncbi:MAG: CHAT domain-containing protein [Oligoflexia bacterium]|nr:CHAT domain-containing protein [Oligoflexia bacterium]